ncbi:MAG: hypothetical protein IGS03_15700 [Candidatus Sericytochromatia bacterium]|nr:hypothetical protein [Candidatus Sericytochromatia bacterium]
MSTLGQLGVRGMVAVNSWLGVINSNLIGSSRTAYKTVRPVLIDAPSADNIVRDIQIPSATLIMQATSIEWAQGAIINSDQSSHFALNGEGFFVVVDPAGRYYLTRDGEFHWDHQGYLVNSSGLRVVSSGQDFIRYAAGDETDMFNTDGLSRDLARYGDKSFLVVDVANRQGLRMSRYGSTVLEIDGPLPLRVVNDFSESMDGLTFVYRDPKQLTYVDPPQQPFVQAAAGVDSDFQIDLGGNGTFSYFAQTGAMFDPATDTIQDVEDAINAYALANNLNLQADYDASIDRLIIVNIPESKVNDPGFTLGNIAIDFGDNGLFTYHGFDPGRTSIRDIIEAIAAYAQRNNVNVSASFDPVTGLFQINNTVPPGGNNVISIDGANGPAFADFFNLNVTEPSTGGGLSQSTSGPSISRQIAGETANVLANVTLADMNKPLNELIYPPSRLRFRGANGRQLREFFKFDSPFDTLAVSGPFRGTRYESRREIDNSQVLDNSDPNRHSLDIAAGDVNTRSFNAYISTSDTTYPVQDFAGPPPRYFHDKTNGRVISDGTTNSNGAAINGHGILAIGQAQTTDAFDLIVDYETSTTVLELHFGYKNPDRIDSGGYSLYYNTTDGSVEIYTRSNNPNDAPVLALSLPAGTLPVSQNVPNSRLVATLNKAGAFTFSVNGATPVSFSALRDIDRAVGHLALGHQGGRLEIDHLHADFKALYNTTNTGMIVSMGNTPYAAYEVSAPARVRGGGVSIVQSALESATASLTEYVPMLSLAQKVFSALSKVITINNAIQDDVNALLR